MTSNLRKTKSSHDRLLDGLARQTKQSGEKQQQNTWENSLNNIQIFRQAWQPKGGNLRKSGGTNYGSDSFIPDIGQPTPNIGPAPEPPMLKLGPKLGRTVSINENAGVDVTAGMRKLDMLIATNRIRGDFNSQKFHERAGMKRKRLRSMRWRTRFKLGFHHMCSRAIKLKKQGW